MGLKESEKALLARAGFASGIVEVVSAEASRMSNLKILRLDAQWPVRPLLSALAVAATLVLFRQSTGVWIIVAILLTCAVLAAAIWFNSRNTAGLLERAPERWAARHLAGLALKGSSQMEELEQRALHYRTHASPHAALSAMGEAERERRGPVRWFHDAIIVSAILIPLAMVIAVPVLQGRF